MALNHEQTVLGRERLCARIYHPWQIAKSPPQDSSLSLWQYAILGMAQLPPLDPIQLYHVFMFIIQDFYMFWFYIVAIFRELQVSSTYKYIRQFVIDNRQAICIYLVFTPWSRVLLEKLTVSQLVKKFSTFCGTRRFITAFRRARLLFIS